MTDAQAALRLTGERTLPGIWHERYWFARHEVTYRFVARLLAAAPAGDPVLVDAGSGEGYGSEHLRVSVPARTLAVDYDEASVAHVRRTYPQVAVARGNLVALPLRTGSVDAVVSLQTVEHLWDQGGFVAECARVLRTGGLLALSTPNRLTFSPGVGRGERPLNPFHVNELDAAELVELLAGLVGEPELLGVHHGPRIMAYEDRHGDVVRAQLAGPYDEWEHPLADFVRSVRADDFVVAPDGDGHPLDASLDLVAVGRAA